MLGNAWILKRDVARGSLLGVEGSGIIARKNITKFFKGNVEHITKKKQYTNIKCTVKCRFVVTKATAAAIKWQEIL